MASLGLNELIELNHIIWQVWRGCSDTCQIWMFQLLWNTKKINNFLAPLWLRIFYFPDITAVCILESFQNPTTLQTAERVLKQLGKDRAEEAYKVRYPPRINPWNYHPFTCWVYFWKVKIYLCFLPFLWKPWGIMVVQFCFPQLIFDFSATYFSFCELVTISAG